VFSVRKMTITARRLTLLVILLVVAIFASVLTTKPSLQASLSDPVREWMPEAWRCVAGNDETGALVSHAESRDCSMCGVSPDLCEEIG
jgi:hypothetical protein